MNWFRGLTDKEQKLLTYKQKQELANFDRKVERGNRNWNRMTVAVGTNVIDKRRRPCSVFTADFILSQNFGFLQPIECQIVKLLAQKYKLTEIADMLGLSYCRIRGLVVKIRNKCELCNS